MSARTEESRRYYLAHREEVKARVKARWDSRKDELNEERRARHAESREEDNEARRASLAADPVKASRRRETHRKWMSANAEKAAQYKRNELAARYGVDPAVIDELRSVSSCDICGTTEPGGPHGLFCIDHDHDSMTIRGVLCNRCNTAIGQFEDNHELMRAAIAYLLRADNNTERGSGDA